MLREVRAALAAAQETQDALSPATTALIPKPRGTSGRGNFNLANEMHVDKKVRKQIQVSSVFSHSVRLPTSYLQAFVCSLVNMSCLDKSISWKNQPGDEVHKIFTIVCVLSSPWNSTQHSNLIPI
jgi:hypothetical protein